jgi:hypothetical protein
MYVCVCVEKEIVKEANIKMFANEEVEGKIFEQKVPY